VPVRLDPGPDLQLTLAGRLSQAKFTFERHARFEAETWLVSELLKGIKCLGGIDFGGGLTTRNRGACCQNNGQQQMVQQRGEAAHDWRFL
jgi:hypothetical protein